MSDDPSATGSPSRGAAEDPYVPPGWSLPPPAGWAQPTAPGWSDPSGASGFSPPQSVWHPPGAAPTSGRRALPLLAVAIAGTILVGAAAGVGVAFLTRSGQPGSPGGAAPTDPPTTVPSQATALYQQAVATTRTAAGFHYVEVSSGPQTQTIVGDAGPDGGRQVITFNTSYGTEQFTLLLVGSTVYFQGNAPALQDQLGVPAAKTAPYLGKWVTVLAADGPYSVLQPGITTAEQAKEIPLVPTSTTAVTTADGVTATRIIGAVPPAQQGGPPGTGHLDILPATHAPITYVSSINAGGISVTSSTTFTKWGTAPTVSAPSGSVLWSTIGAVEPPGGYGNGVGGTVTPSPSPTGQPI